MKNSTAHGWLKLCVRLVRNDRNSKPHPKVPEPSENTTPQSRDFLMGKNGESYCEGEVAVLHKLMCQVCNINIDLMGISINYNIYYVS